MGLNYGLIHDYDESSRVIQIIKKRKIEFFYLSKTLYKKYSPYLSNGLYVVFNSSDDVSIHHNKMCYDILSFIRIKNNSQRFCKIYYDIDEVKESMNSILNQDEFKLFLDLEFTMPPHKGEPKPKRKFSSEIIQYGLCLINKDNEIIDSESNYVLPRYKEDLNERLFNFLNISREHYISKAGSYKKFYNNLKYFIDKYHPKIYVWGKNDKLFLNKSYGLHNLEPLTDSSSFIDLMALVKNYYGIHNDIGLFDCLFKLKGENDIQIHDALDDAEVTSEIFILFQEELNKHE